MNVTLRDGTSVPFNDSRIFYAIRSAFKATGYNVDDKDAEDYVSESDIQELVDAVPIWDNIEIETIQDEVEEILMEYGWNDVAKEYILYRQERKLARLARSENKLMKEVHEKLHAQNVENQNANVDEKSFSGRGGEAEAVVSKKDAIDFYLSDMSRTNHEENMIYIHDLREYSKGSHNCFERSTRFITSKGVKSFEDFNDGDVIKVLTPTGKWCDATVRCFGVQPTKLYTLRKNRTVVKVRATPNHRWINNSGEFQEGLKLGDRLMDAPFFWEDFRFEDLSEDSKKWWCKGFVLGDGTTPTIYSKAKKEYVRRTDISKVKLCGKKSKYLEYFQACGYGLKCSSKEPEISLDFPKEIPNIDDMTVEQINAFIHGLYAADGGHSLTSYGKPIYQIQFTSEEYCKLVENMFPVVGLYVNSIIDKTGQETNFGVRGYTKNYQFFGAKSSRFTWNVLEIEKADPCEVWCLDVDTEHAFVLENGIPTGNCLTYPIDKSLREGVKIKDVDIRPAKSLNTACQLIAVLFQTQSMVQFGGVSCGNLDWSLVPYYRLSFFKHYNNVCDHIPLIGKLFMLSKDFDIRNISVESEIYKGKSWFNIVRRYLWKKAFKDTNIELHQSIEALYHNLNSLLSRSGGQLPFSSINYGTCTSLEGREVTKAILNCSLEGIGKFHKTSIFPCGIYKLMDGVNKKPGDPNYDLKRLALKSTAKRLYPNYANVEWSGNKGFDRNDPDQYYSSMGCRTFNGYDINGMGFKKDGRGNICPVTIILPTLAMMVKDSNDPIEQFMKLLDKKIHEAKDMLLERFEHICSQSPDSAKFMWENGTMAGYEPEKGIRSALIHGTLSVGQLGLAETLQILIGCDHTDPSGKGMKLAKRIEQLFKVRCAEFKEQYHLNFGVYYTPAENLCYTAMNKFKEKYGTIPNVSDHEYFTNSIHVPVWKEMSPFEKIDIESQLTGYSNAG